MEKNYGKKVRVFFTESRAPTRFIELAEAKNVDRAIFVYETKSDDCKIIYMYSK